MSNKSRQKVARGQTSVFAERVLRKLNTGNEGLARPDGGYRIGNLIAPAALVRELRHRDFVKAASGARLEISDIGAAYICRRDTAKRESDCRSHKRPGPFAAQHQVIHSQNTFIDGKVEARDVNIGDTPLGWLRSRKGRNGRPMISQRQYEAGERLRRDFDMATAGQRLTQSYDADRLPSHGKAALDDHGPTIARLAARQRYENAAAELGAGLSCVVERVCCQLEGLEQAERAMGWPTRSGKVVLLIGLDRLADHYHLPPDH